MNFSTVTLLPRRSAENNSCCRTAGIGSTLSTVVKAIHYC